MSHLRHYAVLTGRIIRSNRLKQEEIDRTRAAFDEAVSPIRKWCPVIIPDNMKFSDGNSWRLLLPRPHRAMRVALFLRASLVAGGHARTRWGIGLGYVEQISTGAPESITCEACSLSDSALAKFPGSAQMNLAMLPSAPALSKWVCTSVHLCDSLVQQWTRRQAQLVLLALDPAELTQDEMAASLQPVVSRQAVSKVLRGAHWAVLERAIHQFEHTAWEEVLP